MEHFVTGHISPWKRKRRHFCNLPQSCFEFLCLFFFLRPFSLPFLFLGPCLHHRRTAAPPSATINTGDLLLPLFSRLLPFLTPLLPLVSLSSHPPSTHRSFATTFSATHCCCAAASLQKLVSNLEGLEFSSAPTTLNGAGSGSSNLCINDTLTDDELRLILAKLESEKDKEIFGLVCKRWLRLQSTERKKLAARAGISDVGMKAIGEGLSLLQSLDVSYCRKLTDKGLSAVAKGCSDLRVLHLAGCRFVTDGILEALSKSCHNMKKLGLQGCTNITNYGLISLASGCQQIKYLDINKWLSKEKKGEVAGVDGG
ncbi:F-box proteinB [Arachis hypogaea]|nr:F-box proteinB [Arachis hypogaea]